jgi:hypothetical protein
MGKKSGSGSGINNPDHKFRELRNNFGLFPGSGMGKIRIRDGKDSDPGKHSRSATLVLIDSYIS